MSDDHILEINKRLNDISDRLACIETKLCERCETRGMILESLKDRVRILELKQAKVIGGAVFLSVTMGYILKGLGLG